MKRSLLLLAFILFANFAFAGTAPVPDDWDKKHADKALVMLFYSIKTELSKDGSYIRRIRSVKKIQNEDGMSAGEISCLYHAKREKIKSIKAFITTPDSRKYPYKMIQDLDASSVGDYSDFRKKVITMPNVVVGSIIDFEIEEHSRFNQIQGHYFDTIDLVQLQPFKQAREVLSVPEGMRLYFKNINSNRQPSVKREKGKIVYTWEFKGDEIYDEDLANEEVTPPLSDIAPFTCISTMQGWQELAAWYWQIFSRNAVSNEAIKKEVKRLVADKKTAEDKILAISRYLYDNFRYLELGLNEHNFEPHPATEVFANKFGDCKDQTALFITMLKEAGIDAAPVLVADRYNGEVRKLLPHPGSFDHIIAAIKVGGKTYFADPLVEGYLPNEIPAHLEGDYAFIITKDAGIFTQIPWLPLEQKTAYSRHSVQLSADGSGVFDKEIRFNRQKSIEIRKSLKLATERAKQELLERFKSYTSGGEITGYEIIGQDDTYKALALRLKGLDREAVKPRGRIMLLGTICPNLTHNLYTEKRKYPVWMGEESRDINIAEYVIPQGFVFEYIPGNVNIKSEWLDAQVTYRRQGRKIIQERIIYYKQSLVPASRYQEFKDFLRKTESDLNEAVIIRKKSDALGRWHKRIRAGLLKLLDSWPGRSKIAP